MVIVLVTIVIISLLSLLPPLLIGDLIDNAIPNEDLGRVTLLGAGMVLVPLLNGGFGVLQRWASSSIGEGIIFDLRCQLFAHLQRMSLGFFTATRTGELMSRLNNDVVGAQQAVTGTFVTLAANIVSVTAILIVMMLLEWRLTLLALVILPMFIIVSRRVGRMLRRVRREQLEENAEMNALMQETLGVSGALLVKLFGRADYEDDRFRANARRVGDLGIRQATIGRWFFMALGVMSALGTAVVFWIGAVLVINGDITVGVIVSLSFYLNNLYGPLSGLTNARVEFATSLVSFERVFEVLDLPHDIEESEDAESLADVRGEVQFDGVWFSYGGQQGLQAIKRYGWGGVTEGEDGPSTPAPATWALQDVSFTVRPGELIALVGPSGAGKTTSTYLVPRIYDTDRGAVRIDGHDVRSLSLASLAQAVGVVTQESYLFHDTIAANLRYARPDATDAELRSAAVAANIDQLISSLPDGYDTMVGERGYRLSGGEKQRIAIARVILKDPQILILDEATSHLDAHAEALIQEALEHVMEGRTSLVIAHRLSTILAADRILVMSNGQVVEEGAHDELLAADGLYASLYRTQFAGNGVMSEPNG
ncbi:MAG: ABC transporter ATP-binding protein [Acidimicrobiia bacterium]|nr:ABC transporter ATP-binding protein [Acidimicrobiia bacterium]